ncbi:hypothetical protein Tco_0180534 [Tanacetum coccineum]
MVVQAKSLKNNSFIEIQKLFDKAMTRVNMFVDMDTELVKESSKKAEEEMAQESSSKRAGEELEQEDQHTPIETQKPLLKDEDGEEVDVHMYRSVIGSLMYLTSSRPDIMFAQFWTTAKVKTINGETQLHARVDGKKIIITESTVRRDLQLKDAKDEAVYKELDDSLVRAATTTSSLEEEPDNGVNTPQSDEDSMKLKELMEFCTKLQQRVLDLVNTKTTHAQEITSLKLRVKKLEKKGGSITHKPKRLYKVGRSARVIASDEASLGDQEDASKQGRKIDDIDKDVEITLVDETQGRYGDDLIFDTGVLDDEEVFPAKEINVTEKEVSTADLVTTVGEVVTTASVEISTANPTKTTITDDLTLAQTLIEIRSAKPKVKRVVIGE